MLGWPKSSFEYLCCCCILLSRLIATPRAIAHILWKNPNELFDQPSMNHYHLHQQSYQETAWLPIFTSPLIPTITSESFSLRACARAHTHTHTHTLSFTFLANWFDLADSSIYHTFLSYQFEPCSP